MSDKKKLESSPPLPNGTLLRYAMRLSGSAENRTVDPDYVAFVERVVDLVLDGPLTVEDFARGALAATGQMTESTPEKRQRLGGFALFLAVELSGEDGTSAAFSEEALRLISHTIASENNSDI